MLLFEDQVWCWCWQWSDSHQQNRQQTTVQPPLSITTTHFPPLSSTWICCSQAVTYKPINQMCMAPMVLTRKCNKLIQVMVLQMLKVPKDIKDIKATKVMIRLQLQLLPFSLASSFLGKLTRGRCLMGPNCGGIKTIQIVWYILRDLLHCFGWSYNDTPYKGTTVVHHFVYSIPTKW